MIAQRGSRCNQDTGGRKELVRGTSVTLSSSLCSPPNEDIGTYLCVTHPSQIVPEGIEQNAPPGTDVASYKSSAGLPPVVHNKLLRVVIVIYLEPAVLILSPLRNGSLTIEEAACSSTATLARSLA